MEYHGFYKEQSSVVGTKTPCVFLNSQKARYFPLGDGLNAYGKMNVTTLEFSSFCLSYADMCQCYISRPIVFCIKDTGWDC